MSTKEIKKIKRKIEQILITDLFSRDDDIRLMDKVWNSQYPKLNTLSYNEFIILLKDKVLSSPESIRRSRQKLQELNPNTRGLVYYKRKKMTEEYKSLLKEYHKL